MAVSGPKGDIRELLLDFPIVFLRCKIFPLVVLEPACAAERSETVYKIKGNKGNTGTVTIAAHLR
jgi:hypothetical protein